MQENNAITHRISQMQTKWFKKVQEDTQLVRWLIDDNEHRMLEAFILLESGEHGGINELFFPFTIPFFDSKEDPFALNLKNFWINTWNNKTYREEIPEKLLPKWDSTLYENTDVKNKEHEFITCMSSFASSIDKNTKLVLVLFPENLKQLGKQWSKWILNLTEKLPKNLRLMVVDYKDSSAFNFVPNQVKEVVINANLNMFEAMKEIVASSGDANETGIAVNTCIINIFEALQKENIRGIELWGDKGIEVAQEANSKSLEATVLITYGSAYYQLKKYNDALQKFSTAINKCNEGIAKEDTVCKTVLLQAYNFTASTYHVKNKKDEAITYYIKTANIAKTQKVYPTYIESLRVACELHIKQFNSREGYKLLNTCITNVKDQDKLMLKYTTFYLVCGKLYDYYYKNNEQDKAKKIELLAFSIWGENWKKLNPKEMIQPTKAIKS